MSQTDDAKAAFACSADPGRDLRRASARARMIMETLPYIREFAGQTVVVKYGGNAMIDENLKKSFARSIVLLKYIGVNPIIVHGGGPQIGKMLAALHIASEFRQGLRVTDGPTMDVVEMVLVGKVNKEIVNLLNLAGGRAVGLSGKDGMLIRAEKKELAVNRDAAPPEIIDLGMVGEVTSIDTSVLTPFMNSGMIPVIAPVGVDDAGRTYNINADSVAGAMAAAIRAKRLHLLTDVPGVLDKDKRLIRSMTSTQAFQAIENGVVVGGMIPKIQCALEAVMAGVEKAHIIDGRIENCVLLEMFTNCGIGTEITR